MRIKKPWINALLSALMTAFFRALFRTLRLEFHLSRPQTSPYQPADSQHFVYSVWHDSMIVPVFAGRQPATVALVGPHHDGSYVSNVLKSVGIPAVRGSSSHGGAKAVRQLLADTQNCHIVMTPDGPRGPRREIKAGLAFVAAKTGKAVVPTAFSCSRSWSIQGSWTDLMIPSPFAKVYILTGQPIAIPADADRNTLAEFTSQIQTAMDELNAQAETLAGKTQPQQAQFAPRKKAA